MDQRGPGAMLEEPWPTSGLRGERPRRCRFHSIGGVFRVHGVDDARCRVRVRLRVRTSVCLALPRRRNKHLAPCVTRTTCASCVCGAGPDRLRNVARRDSLFSRTVAAAAAGRTDLGETPGKRAQAFPPGDFSRRRSGRCAGVFFNGMYGESFQFVWGRQMLYQRI